MSTVIFGGVVLQLPIGRWSDRVDRRRILAATCLLGAFCACVGWAVLDLSRPFFLALAFVYGGCAFAVYGLAAAHAIDHLERDQVLPATGGLLRLYGMGAVAGPLLSGGVMASWGAGSFLLFLAAVQVPLVAFLVVRVRRVAPVPPAARGEYVSMMRTTPMAMQMHPEGGEAAQEPQPS
jgi:MFS family permease